jgi:hypothetical protein
VGGSSGWGAAAPFAGIGGGPRSFIGCPLTVVFAARKSAGAKTSPFAAFQIGP